MGDHYNELGVLRDRQLALIQTLPVDEALAVLQSAPVDSAEEHEIVADLLQRQVLRDHLKETP
jgi:hypothetical protein